MNSLVAVFGAFFVHFGSLLQSAAQQRPPVAIAQEVEKTAEKTTRALILGGGIGGLTSSIYLARAGISPVVVEGKTPGGLLTMSHSVQNWPGELEIEGEALTEKIRDQALKNGVEFLKEEVVSVDFSNRPFVVTTRSLDQKGDHKIFADTCIIAMGTTPNMLGVNGEEKFWGKGVTNCAICDGALYRNLIVGVVGGGDAAILEALYLSNLAKEVHLFIRGDKLRATEKKRIEILRQKPNVMFHENTEVVEIKGSETALTGVVLKKGGSLQDFSLDGLFLAIGSRPNTQIFQNRLQLDNRGYIQLKKDQETAIAGVYAVGDIVDPVYKQAITAAGEGAKAALQAENFLMNLPPHRLFSQNFEMAALNKPTEKATGTVLEISSIDQFQKELRSATSPVVIDFYAKWCGPCRQIAPLVEATAKRLRGKTQFLKVDVDKMSDLSRSYEIRAMPTVLLIDPSGKVLDRRVGGDQIRGFLESI